MAIYSGTIDSYDLHVESPNVHTNYKRIIHLRGNFGLGFICFVPKEGTLGENGKRTGVPLNIFDVYYWESAWEPIVDILRNEKPVKFSYETARNTAQIYTGMEPVGEEES